MGSWVISQFCVSDYKVKWEFIITIPDSSFTLRAGWHLAGMRGGGGSVITIQDRAKAEFSRAPADIPNSPEEIATPTSLGSHRIRPVAEAPLGDPKGAPGETRPS